MKNVLILLLIVPLVTPAFASRHGLQGPSRVKSKRIVRVNTGHPRYGCRSGYYGSYRLNRNSRKLYRVHRQPRQIVVVLQTQNPVQKRTPRSRVSQRFRNRTIFIGSTKLVRRTYFPHPGRKVPDWVKNCE